jgi:hypothetical protein
VMFAAMEHLASASGTAAVVSEIGGTTTYNCFNDLEFPRISRILPLVHKGFLQNRQANDKAA